MRRGRHVIKIPAGNEAKRDVLVSERYATFEMRHVLSEHLRAASFDHDVTALLGASPN